VVGAAADAVSVSTEGQGGTLSPLHLHIIHSQCELDTAGGRVDACITAIILPIVILIIRQCRSRRARAEWLYRGGVVLMAAAR
jgi:hypothetical protein